MSWAQALFLEVRRCRDACAPMPQNRRKVAMRSMASFLLEWWNMSEVGWV